ncbi:hypothetical protein [Roseomonas genomospecies 6]|uniref:Uncharacterized protein n=1 Tax=Roseomonas genomospecies 6 TaxID=214106 RepID=A0A9W7NDS5_9PROT|nr:hypothetical protein [Roseomonas genomospecies 6]KAA0675827.1 hypothetical protein DS843_29810 [Roseomonas genomospecies 6]
MHDTPEIAEGESAHSLHSTLRERIVEHVFIGDALRRLWQREVRDVEILRSEFDAGGYDLVMSRGRIVRHIQFKTTLLGGRTTSIKISLKLMEKPSGCVVWIIVAPDLTLNSFLWLGGQPGEPLPDIGGLKVVRHTKGNSAGMKAERSNHRIVPRRRFDLLPSLDAVLARLFGPLP